MSRSQFEEDLSEEEILRLKAEIAEWKATAGHEVDGLESWKKVAEKAEAELANALEEVERLRSALKVIADNGRPACEPMSGDIAQSALAGKEKEDGRDS